VSAFAAPGETRGRELILAAYAEAIRKRYRFFSYGDAMLIV
jgi:S-adenosylmethionine:tRNA ribosyltransferase-isomerase